MNKNTGIIEQLLHNRKLVFELIVAAVLLGLSVNLISGAFIELKWLSTKVTLIAAVLLLATCVGYFAVGLLKTRTNSHQFSGFIICNPKTNHIVDVPRYDYGRDLHNYLRCAFTENGAMKRMWDKDPIHCGFKEQEGEYGSVTNRKTKAHGLIVEATEYYVLENLSTHLTDYFNGIEADQSKLTTFARNDIPDVLLSNRFLELFSKPMEDRTIFEPEDADTSKGRVVMMMGSAGSFYSAFDLTLPTGARVWRNDENAIVISTKRFELTLGVNFDGFNTVIPPQFKTHMLGLDFRTSDYKIDIDVTVKFSFGSLLLPSGWEYYRWIESFLQTFESEFSERIFFEQIGWESALTVIEGLAGKHSTAVKF
jgi:hypothetical protein